MLRILLFLLYINPPQKNMKKFRVLLISLLATTAAVSCGGGGGDKLSSGIYTPPANVEVSSVSVSPTTSELVIGGTVQLSATVNPSNATDKSVSWSSSNQTIAKVTPTGLVTAVAKGTAVITASSGGKTASCSVTVKKPYADVVFDDNIFKAYCVNLYDVDKDGEIDVEEAKKITRLEIQNKGIKSVTGINAFENLTYLNCSVNQLKKLDLSGKAKLTDLNCLDNQLELLELKGCVALKRLNCGYNKLKKLDLKNSTEISTVKCDFNELTILDLEGCNKLLEVNCANNKISKLDLSKSKTLQNVICENNQIEALDVANNPYLALLRADNNKIKTLDLKGCSYLMEVSVGNNQLTEFVPEENVSYNLNCYGNSIAEIDLSKTAINSLGAWPMTTFKILKIKKGRYVNYYYYSSDSAFGFLNPEDYGTTVIEVE